MRIKSAEVLDDIRSAAWLESELHPELDRHRRHEMADICEEGNIERVWRVLGVSVAEIRVALRRILLARNRGTPDNTLECPEGWDFRFVLPVAPSVFTFIKEKIHEYLVARVMADRTAVIVPGATGVWEERAKDALASLTQAAASVRLASGCVRRPLWPL